MKRIINISIIACCLLAGNLAMAQLSPGEQQAWNMAGKIRDSLGLNNVQRDSIYAINLSLNQKKSLARKQYVGDELRQQIQRLENQRDQRYAMVFANEERILRYRKLKHLLIAGN